MSNSEESRSIVVGSFRRAFADTDSRLLKSYVLVSALVTGLLLLFLLLALPVWIFSTQGGSELSTFSRAFLLVFAVVLLVPLLTPILSSARRHQRGAGSASADVRLALSGYLFIASLYLALVISAPADQRGAPPAAIAPVVEYLYSLPPLAGLVPPIASALLVLVVHKFAR
ncbi:hypothetical protein [Halorussus halophilus]|uniref:hypothetical protein n=1 Tax=Halorussus halophilus TaxID=2650975 RepID=UPI0013011ED5|nr:hypothetical protein [Halorussus halophilus]